MVIHCSLIKSKLLKIAYEDIISKVAAPLSHNIIPISPPFLAQTLGLSYSESL